jgi:hypothetical protein
MSNPTTALIELRHHYESVIAQSESRLAEATAQLKHIDTLLLNRVLQGQESPALAIEISPQERSALASALEVAFIPTELPASATPEPTLAPAIGSEPIAAKPKPAQGDRTPRPLLPAYEGLKRLEAIAKALQATAGRELTIGKLIEELFGPLGAADQKSEMKRLYTLLYNGEKRGLWKKGKAPSSYKMSQSKVAENSQPTPHSKPTAPATKSSSGGSLALLPEFDGMNKLEAISKALNTQSGHVLHQDSIMQMLYGDLSPEIIKKESRKLRASLFQGVSKGLWQKAPKQPSSYLVTA